MAVRRTALGLTLLWLVGFNFRSVIFSLPPVLPQVKSELNLSFAFTGSLTSITVFFLGLAALPGAKLGNRLGAGKMVGFGSLALVGGALARLLAPGVFWLPVGTALLTLAVAFAQPAVSALTRAWFPGDVQRASTVYINGQLLGGLLGIAVTPLFVPAFGWRGALLVWTAVALAGAVLWVFAVPADTAHAEEPRRLRSLFREPDVWVAAGILTAQNLTYFTAATFLPFLLRDRGADYVALVFFLMNGIAVLPTALAALRWSFASSVGFYVASGVLAGGGSLLLLLGLKDAAWVAGLGIGLGTSMSYLGILSLVPRFSPKEDVAGYSAIVLTVGYLLTFIGPLAAGSLVDVSRSITWAFLPSVVSGLLMVALGFSASRFRRLAQVAPVAA